MANYCNFSMCVKGTKENIEDFLKVMKADYNYDKMEFTHDRHFFRVFESNCDEIVECEDGRYKAIIGGYCAHSVNSCMFDDIFTYYRTGKEYITEDYKATTLPIESKNLGLDIEVYSEEPGCAFQEHYVIVNGDVIIDKCVKWKSYWLDNFETKEEAERELGITIYNDEWEENYVERGGFREWNFVI